MWPFNYPGDIYSTNVFNQVIILFEEIGEKAKDLVEEISSELKNE